MYRLKEKHMFNNVSAAIIAGGKSRRFGAPKTQAVLREQTLLEHAVRFAYNLSGRVHIIGDLGFPARPGLSIHKDIVSGCGPVCGIYTALHFLENDWLAVMPVDMPALHPSIYRFLYPLAKHGRPVVALSHKGMEPLVSLWPRTALSAFEQAIAQKQYRLYKILEQLRAVEAPLVQSMPDYDPEWFVNINYKQDLAQLIQGKSAAGQKF